MIIRYYIIVQSREYLFSAKKYNIIGRYNSYNIHINYLYYLLIIIIIKIYYIIIYNRYVQNSNIAKYLKILFAGKSKLNAK